MHPFLLSAFSHSIGGNVDTMSDHPHSNPMGQYYNISPTMQRDRQQSNLFPESGIDSITAIAHEQDGGNNALIESHHATSTSQQLPPGADHVKHRRTRSGCYTCRGRRVKCDESRPNCERCRKGSRECVYPEPRPSTKLSTHSKLGKQKGNLYGSESSSDEFDLEDQVSPSFQSDGLRKDGRPQQSIPESRKLSSKERARLANQITHSIEQHHSSIELADELGRQSLSPSTGSSGTFTTPLTTTITSEDPYSVSRNSPKEFVSWSHLPEELQFYLDYHSSHINHHSYFFKRQSRTFLHVSLLGQALAYEPLLFAVVGFAAFRMAIENPDGKVEDFLEYYNLSVIGLRRSLEAGQAHTESMLLTILQLATFEEYLGDWVNLLGHQKAAYLMLLELYTPNSIAQNEMRRQILSWYSRFDIFAGVMSGYETMLGRDWHLPCEVFHREQSQECPQNMDYKIESAIVSHRLILIDMTLLFAEFTRRVITLDYFKNENEKLAKRIIVWKQHLDMLRSEPESTIDIFEVKRDSDLANIIEPHMPGGFHSPGLSTLNFMLMDWHALDLVHRYQGALLLGQQPPPELGGIAMDICRMVEAVDCWSGGLPGALLSAQALIGIATMFLPKDDRHIMWCRLKLAKIEGMGYIYPQSFRLKMATLWKMPDVSRWWLPGNKSYPALVQNIRGFINDRTAHSKNQPQSEDVRNMKALLSNLSVLDKKF